MSQQLTQVALKDLHLNPNNPSTRNPDKELINSIRDVGIRNPLLVKKNGNGYVIIAGERRFKSAMELGFKEVPVIIQEDITTDIDATTLLLVDNIHRKNMNMYEEYQVIDALIKQGVSVADVAKKLNKSSVYVTRRLGLNNLIPEVVKAIQNNCIGLTERMVFVFARLPRDVQKELASSSFETVRTDGKEQTIIVRNEEELERLAARKISDAILDGEANPKDIVTMFATSDGLGKQSLETVIENHFSEKKTVFDAPIDEAKVKETKKLLKQFGEVTKLSVSDGLYSNDGRIPQSQWRTATKSDDPKDVKTGVIVNGPKIGVLTSYVTVKPKKQTEQKKAVSPKQAEQNKKERKEKIFNNKVSNEVVERVAEKLFKGAKLTNEVIDYAIDHIPFSHQSAILRLVMDNEERKAVEFGHQDKEVRKAIKGLTPEGRLVCVLLAPYVASETSDVAKLLGMNITEVTKQAKEQLKAEEAKAQKEKKK